MNHDEVESCPPMLAQSKLTQPMTVMEENEKARTRTTLTSAVMQNTVMRVCAGQLLEQIMI